MLIPEYAEPASVEMVADWVTQQRPSHDRFLQVYARSEAHRAEHGPACDVYATSSGPLLGVLTAASGAQRILEVGCGLGYSALWLAAGGGAASVVDTCEVEDQHARLAREIFSTYGVAQRITVHEGRASEIVRGLTQPYDLAFLDADPGEYPDLFEHFLRLLRPGGLLISSNLFLAVHVPDAPYLSAAAAYRDLLMEDRRLQTAFLPSGLALSIRL